MLQRQEAQASARTQTNKPMVFLHPSQQFRPATSRAPLILKQSYVTTICLDKQAGIPTLDSIFPCPFPGCGFVAGTVGFVHMCDFRDKRVVGVGVCQHRAYREENYKSLFSLDSKIAWDAKEQTFRDCQCRTPLIPQNVQADRAVGIDIGVIDAGGEVDLWRLEGVVCGEMDGEEEDTARVRRITL